MQQLSLLDWAPEPEAIALPPSLQPKPPPKPHALAWHYAGLHYYRRLMLRFMSLPKAASPNKQAARRHIISHLHRLSEDCADKIKLLEGN